MAGATVAQLDAQGAVAGYSVARVDRQIEDRELELVGVDLRRSEIGIFVDCEMGAVSQRPTKQVFDAGEEAP